MTLELVRSSISHDTVQALLDLAEEAKTGVYTGFAIGLIRPHMRYTVHCVGEACDRPTWARGVVQALDDELRDIVQSRGFEETR